MFVLFYFFFSKEFQFDGFYLVLISMALRNSEFFFRIQCCLTVSVADTKSETSSYPQWECSSFKEQQRNNWTNQESTTYPHLNGFEEKKN